MKVNVSLFGDEKKQVQDQELFRTKDFALQTITLWMRLCAVKKAQIDRVRVSEASTLSTMSWKGLDENIPDIIKHIRSYILLHIIKTLMDMFGIKIVEIELETTELQEQRKYWDFLVKGDAGKDNSSGLDLKTIPLNIEKDPTNKTINTVNDNR